MKNNTYTGTLKRVEYDINALIDHIDKSDYTKKIRVWSGIIKKELETAREQAVPFVWFAEKYASDHNDMERPFISKTWNAAYESWRRSDERR